MNAIRKITTAEAEAELKKNGMSPEIKEAYKKIKYAIASCRDSKNKTLIIYENGNSASIDLSPGEIKLLVDSLTNDPDPIKKEDNVIFLEAKDKDYLYEPEQNILSEIMEYLRKVTDASKHGCEMTNYEFHKGSHKAYLDILGKLENLTSKKL